MELTSKNRRFTMHVEGYQFPDLPESSDRYDRNWLMMHCEITTPRGEWHFTDPFMLTWDVERWITWFDDLAVSKVTTWYALSYDHVVNMHLVSVSEDHYSLTARFYQEGRPPWINSRIYNVCFSVTTEQMRAAAATLREDLRHFPPRGSNPFVRRQRDGRQQ
jgi:hypothetical protein